MTTPITSRNEDELKFEKDLIEQLTTGSVDPVGIMNDQIFSRYNNRVYKTKLWEYRPDIKTTEDLWDNFKEILEQHNQEVLDRSLTPSEFEQVKKQIESLDTPYKAGRFLYGLNGISQVEVVLEDNKHVYLTVFDQEHIGCGDTVYQVVNQIVRPPVLLGKHERRFDVTLLINGLPIIQIELKRKGKNVMEAFNQIQQYMAEHQYSGIYSTVQIFVGMTPTESRYMANTTLGQFNTDFTFHWQENNARSRMVHNWKEFANQFLSIPRAHNMATTFMVLDGAKGNESLKVMRPYQVYATENVLAKVRHADFDIGTNQLGYIWHTTGSGKTITSFKTAWLSSRMSNIDKVVFLVDRKALTQQTFEKYEAYNPEAKSISEDRERISRIRDTRNTNELTRALNSKGNQIIVTSVQKLRKLVKGRNFKKPNKRILFIVDEAHRSTGSPIFKGIQDKFGSAAWVGYTGTPVFDDKGSGENKKWKTADIFGECLHSYTIREAIADKNVLGFKVDFQTTIDQDSMKTKYLPEFYREQHPEWSDDQIQEKIANLSQEDMDDQISPSFYDNNEDHVELVVKDIVENWANRSSDRKYNALLTTHVNSQTSSTLMAIMYYKAFKRANERLMSEGKKPLKVAVTFSWDSTNGDTMVQSNEALSEAIRDYNQLFGTSFDDNTVDEYFQDVISRLNREAGDGQYLDLVIVIDQLLTGFDAPGLNTLYVDRTLQGANLVQAYSRTNRVEDFTDKPFGRVVNYRWPSHTEKLMNEALAVYSNKEYENLTPDQQRELIEEENILARPYHDVLKDVKSVAQDLRRLTDDFNRIPPSENQQDEMIGVLHQFNAGLSKLKQYEYKVVDGVEEGYDYDHPEKLIEQLDLTVDEYETLVTTLSQELKRVISERQRVPVSTIDLKMTYLKDIRINYDYLTELLENLMNQVHDNNDEEAQKTREDIQKFTEAMDDRIYARDITRAVDAIVKKEFPGPDSDLKYPYRLHNSQEAMSDSKLITMDRVVKDAEVIETNNYFRDFRNRWGIQDAVSSDEIRVMLEGHVFGKKDLESTGFLNNLLREGSRSYKQMAEDEEIRSLTKLKYRNRLKEAFYQLADEEKREL